MMGRALDIPKLSGYLAFLQMCLKEQLLEFWQVVEGWG